jgi:predicted nucleic acid-binding Zn ribbon protein
MDDLDYIRHLTITNFCWRCGRVATGRLFCNDKCKQQYIMAQDRKIRRGKRAGYGLAGSTR